MPIRNGRRF